MRKLFLAFAAIHVMAVAHAEDLSDVAYAKYQILGQATVPNQPGGGMTYVVTYSPSMAIVLNEISANVVHRIASGHLKRCRQVTADRVRAFQQTALSQTSVVTGVEMVKSTGKPITNEAAQAETNAKAMIAFANETEDKPVYYCEVPR